MKFWTNLVSVGLLCGSYLLFVGTCSVSEVLAAIPAVSGSIGFSVLQKHYAIRSLTVRVPWHKAVGYLSKALIRDTILVADTLLRSIVKPMTGKILFQPFKPGGNGGVSAGRRAVVILSASLAPNGYVAGETAFGLLVHQLIPEPEKPDKKWPI